MKGTKIKKASLPDILSSRSKLQVEDGQRLAGGPSVSQAADRWLPRCPKLPEASGDGK